MDNFKLLIFGLMIMGLFYHLAHYTVGSDVLWAFGMEIGENNDNVIIWENNINLTRDYIIAGNNTLVILPGTTIDLDGWSLIINGTLRAEGTEDEPIVFLTDNVVEGTFQHPITCEYVYDSWLTIPVNLVYEKSSNNRSNIIKFCKIDVWGTGIKCKLASPTIENNLLSTNPQFRSSLCSATIGIRCIASSPRIANNSIQGMSSGEGILCAEESAPMIINNSISQTSSGISVGFSSSPVIICNKIFNSRVGIKGGKNLYVSGNRIFNCSYAGIEAYSSKVTVQSCILTNNSVSIRCHSASLTIINSTILKSKKYDLWLERSSHVIVHNTTFDLRKVHIEDDESTLTVDGKVYTKSDIEKLKEQKIDKGDKVILYLEIGCIIVAIGIVSGLFIRMKKKKLRVRVR